MEFVVVAVRDWCRVSQVGYLLGYLHLGRCRGGRWQTYPLVRLYFDLVVV